MKSRVAPLANIVLIGPRGSGKTHVGEALASMLGWTAVDTDARIQAEAGCTIREIFATEGEAGFRAREVACIAQACAGQERVISVGGGAVLAEENRVAMRGAGFVVWLTATPETLAARIDADPRTAATRPALTSYSGLDEIRALLAAREPLYRETAHYVVDTEARDVDAVAAEIVRRRRDLLEARR